MVEFETRELSVVVGFELHKHTFSLIAKFFDYIGTVNGYSVCFSFVECYEDQFSAFAYDARRGVPLELLLHAAVGVELRDSPSRHLVRPDPPAPPSEYP